MKAEMKKQDLEELYQLLSMYKRTYESKKVMELLEEVEQRYRNNYKEDICKSRNPRNAGRKRQYTDAERKQIHKLRKEGLSIRKISEKTGCSVGYVQGVLSEP